MVVALVCCLSYEARCGQPSEIEWSRTFDENEKSIAYCVRETSDGGYVLTGLWRSVGKNTNRIYLLKLDGNGNEAWLRFLGGSIGGWGECVIETSDGGYVLTGIDVNLDGGNGADVFLAKTDAMGNEQWFRTFGGTSQDYGRCVQETRDGGFIVCGDTGSFGAGGRDAYLIKTGPRGEEVWSRPLGGDDTDYGTAVQQTLDGGYVVTGGTSSFGINGIKVYLAKVDQKGNDQWFRTYGGDGYSWGKDILVTRYNEFVIAGDGERDQIAERGIYLFKTDTMGDEIWSRWFDGPYSGYASSVKETHEGGYLLTGASLLPYAEPYKIHVMKTDSSGTEIWSQKFNDSKSSEGYSICQTRDGGYVLAGQTKTNDKIAGYIAKFGPELPFVDFTRGESNGDGSQNLADVICILSYLFNISRDGCGDTIAQCEDAADVNDDEKLDLADAISLLNYLFQGTGPVPEPFISCGPDKTQQLNRLRCYTVETCPIK